MQREGRVHDAVFSNLTISDTRTAFNFVSSYGRKSRGADIYGIRVQNVRVDSTIFLRMHHMYSTEGLFRDIVFDGVSGAVREPSRIYAKKTRPFENIAFRNVELPCGFVAFNADLRLDGGTFAPAEIPAEERARIEAALDSNINLLY